MHNNSDILSRESFGDLESGTNFVPHNCNDSMALYDQRDMDEPTLIGSREYAQLIGLVLPDEKIQDPNVKSDDDLGNIITSELSLIVSATPTEIRRFGGPNFVGENYVTEKCVDTGILKPTNEDYNSLDIPVVPEFLRQFEIDNLVKRMHEKTFGGMIGPYHAIACSPRLVQVLPMIDLRARQKKSIFSIGTSLICSIDF